MEQSIFLTGFMGAGKSSVGRKLAKKLGVSFIDLDHLIESGQGRSIKAIFETGGEEEFRRVETETLREVLAGPPSVVALGGGILTREENREALAGALVVNLSAPFEELHRRIRSTGEVRPLVAEGGEALRARYEARKPLYDAVERQVDAGKKTTDEVVEEILERFFSPSSKEARCGR